MPRITGNPLRQKILEEAIGIVYREGPDRVTMRSLAEKLGYSPATIYLYFQSKDELFGEIAQHGFEELVKMIELVYDDPDPFTAVREVCRRYLDFGFEHPELYRLMIQEIDMKVPEELRRREDAQNVRGWELCRDAYVRGIASGVFRQGDPEAETALTWSMLHGLVLLVLAGRLPRMGIEGRRGELASLRDALIEERLRALRP